MARPNVKADVRIAADVENIIKELIRAVGNGENASNAGRKVIRVLAAAEFAISS